MKCVLKYTNEKDGWFSWCDKPMQAGHGYNYSFISSLAHSNKNDVCKDCSMAIIRKLLYVMDKENLVLLI